MHKTTPKRGSNARKKPPGLKAAPATLPLQNKPANPINNLMQETALLREMQMLDGTWEDDDDDPLLPSPQF